MYCTFFLFSTSSKANSFFNYNTSYGKQWLSRFVTSSVEKQETVGFDVSGQRVERQGLLYSLIDRDGKN
jgi:hypothetical protein